MADVERGELEPVVLSGGGDDGIWYVDAVAHGEVAKKAAGLFRDFAGYRETLEGRAYCLYVPLFTLTAGAHVKLKQRNGRYLRGFG